MTNVLQQSQLTLNSNLKPNMLKTLLKNGFIQWVICWIIHKYCLLAFYTSRVEYRNRQEFLDLARAKKPIILAFWHGRLLFAPFIGNRKIRKRVHTIVSRHGDGEFIAKAVHIFGAQTIRGSTNRTSDDERGAKDRGGINVLTSAIKVLNQGDIVAFTPDGPRGPRMQIKQISMLKIAAQTGAVVIPITVSASNARFFNSWDRFMFPHPFGKISIIAGQSIQLDAKSDDIILENTRKQLEDSLNTITEQADMAVNITPIKSAK